MDKLNLEEIMLEYINKNQQNDDTKIIPEDIFKISKLNFENHKLKKLYTNYGTVHGVGATAMTIGSVAGFFAGPIGFAIGSGLGGLVWSIASATGTVMDRCVISNKILPESEIKYYSIYKDICFDKNKGFSKYFPENFAEKYNDTIKFKINPEDSLILFNNEKTYNGVITGEFNEFKLININNCTLVPIENYSEAIKLNKQI